MLGTDLATWYYNTNDIQYMVLCDALVLSKCMVILLHRPYPPGFSSMRYVPGTIVFEWPMVALP